MELSNKPLFQTQEFKQKVLKGIEKRKSDRESMTEEVWFTACKKFNSYVFPEKLVTENTVKNPAYNASIGETHERDKQTHHLQTYRWDQQIPYGMEIAWKYTYCPVCKMIVTKSGILIHPFKSQAYRRYFVRNGLTEPTPNTLAISSKPVENINDLFNGSLADPLRGGDLK